MTADELLPELRAHIARKYKKQSHAAKAWGVTGSMVSQVLAGKKHPTKEMLDDVGLVAVVGPVKYVRKAKDAA